MVDRIQSKSPPLSLTIQEQQQHEFLLPTPVSPTTGPPPNHDMKAYIGQFSLKPVSTESEKLFTCITCGQHFNRAHNLKVHKAIHSASKSFQVFEMLPPPFFFFHLSISIK